MYRLKKLRELQAAKWVRRCLDWIRQRMEVESALESNSESREMFVVSLEPAVCRAGRTAGLRVVLGPAMEPLYSAGESAAGAMLPGSTAGDIWRAQAAR